MKFNPGTKEFPEEGHHQLFQIEDASYWFCHRNKVIEWVMKKCPFSGPLFDVGGGNGYQAKMLQEIYPNVSLVEPGKVGCDNARFRGVKKILLSTLEDLHLSTGSIGAISLFDVIEHLDEPSLLLKETHRVLVPSGLVYITVPAYQFLWGYEDTDGLHRRRYTITMLQSLLDSCGFDMVYSSGFFRFLLLPIFFLRAIPYQLGLRREGGQKAKFDQTTHVPNTLSRRILQKLMDAEMNGFNKKERYGWGASLICVGRKR